MAHIDHEIPAVLDAMTMDRGFIVNSYAQVEYLLGRLIFEALRHNAYAHVETKLPFGIDNRIELTRRLLNEGPLAAVSAELEGVLARLLELEPVRARRRLGDAFRPFHTAGERNGRATHP